MASKRRKKQRAARRPGSTPPQTTAPSSVGGDDAVATPGPAPAAARPAAPSATSRYASNISGPRRGVTASTTVGTIDIDERVPYFGKDMRRLLVTAAAMLAIIIAATFFLH